MPVLAANATRDDYALVLPEAAERIAAAVDYLRAKGVEEDRHRLPQPGRIDGECISGAARAPRDRCVGA